MIALLLCVLSNHDFILLLNSDKHNLYCSVWDNNSLRPNGKLITTQSDPPGTTETSMIQDLHAILLPVESSLSALSMELATQSAPALLDTFPEALLLMVVSRQLSFLHLLSSFTIGRIST